jgi:hypothetical protein
MDQRDLSALTFRGEIIVLEFIPGRPQRIKVSTNSSSEIGHPIRAIESFEEVFSEDHDYFYKLEDKQILVPILRIQSPKHRFWDVRGHLSGLGSVRKNIFSYGWPTKAKAVASGGFIHGSLSSGKVLLETPLGSNAPYMFLCLAETRWGLDIPLQAYDISFGSQEEDDMEQQKLFGGQSIVRSFTDLADYRDAIQAVCMHTEDDFNLKERLEE